MTPASQDSTSELPQSIQDVYPRYSRRLLEVMLDDYLPLSEAYLRRTGRAHYELSRSFSTARLDHADLERIKGAKIISMSLYFKAANFARRHTSPEKDERGQIPRSELERLHHPTWEGTPRFERSFLDNYVNDMVRSPLGDWIPVVYLAEDLHFLHDSLRDKGWIVIPMEHSSVAHGPGSMWRFLGFNLDCRCSYIQDTDRTFDINRAEAQLALIEKNPKAALIRPLQWSSPGGEMALILGNDFLVRPENIDFDAARTMLGYLVLNILHEDRVNNFVHEPRRNRDDLAVQAMSKRLQRDHIGPHPNERVANKQFPYYGVDEQWLKEFVYYQLSDGRTMTLLRNNERENDLIQGLDLAFQKLHGNALIPFEEEKAAIAHFRSRTNQGRL